MTTPHDETDGPIVQSVPREFREPSDDSADRQASHDESAGSDEAADGTVLRSAPPADDGTVLRAAPAMADGTVLRTPPADSDGTVLRAAADDGTILRAPHQARGDGQPATDDGTVLRQSERQTQRATSQTPAPAAPTYDVPRAVDSGRHRFITQDRFEAPPEVEETVTAPFPWRRLLNAVIAVCVLGVVSGLVYLQFFRGQSVDPNTVPTAEASTVGPQVVAPTGVAAVQTYLDALAQGDAEKAMSLGDTAGSGSQALLTNTAFQATQRLAPITDIEVGPAADTATSIPAAYTLGDKRVSTTFSVIRRDTGGWALTRTTVSVQIQSPNATRVPVLINGIRVDVSKPFELVPGHYEITTGLPFLQYRESDRLVVDEIAADGVLNHTISPILTREGEDAFLSATRQSYSRCLSVSQTTVPGCPNGIIVQKPVVEGSVRWNAMDDPFEQARPGLIPKDLSIAEMAFRSKVQFQARYTDGTDNGDKDIQSITAIVSANMVVDTADQIAITWRRL